MGLMSSCLRGKKKPNQKQFMDVYPFDDEEDIFHSVIKCCDDPRCDEFFWPGGMGMCRTEVECSNLNR